MSNITISGGTARQQQIILDAHAGAISLLEKAQVSASTGAGPFTAWFGSNDSTSQVAAASVYAGILAFLQGLQFVYDLDAGETPMQSFWNIFVIFNPSQSDPTSVDASLWNGFWSLYGADSARAQTGLAQSVMQAAGVSFNPDTVTEFDGTQDPAGALQLASLAPDQALQSIRNYMSYAGSLAGGVARRLP